VMYEKYIEICFAFFLGGGLFFWYCLTLHSNVILATQHICAGRQYRFGSCSEYCAVMRFEFLFAFL